MFPNHSARLRALAFTVAILATLTTFLVTGCTTSSSEEEFTMAPGTSIVYSDTTHVTQPWGACQNTTRYVAYWGLRYLSQAGDTNSYRWLGVSVSADTITASTWGVGTNTDAEDAESPADKASILIFGATGSLASATGRLRVTPFANGDSIRVEGKNILLQNGKVVSFNLTNRVGCLAS